MDPSLSVLAGPEAAPTSPTLRPDIFPTLGLRSGSSSMVLPSALTPSISVFLSLLGLAALVFAICWTRRTRRRRPASEVLDERALEKAAIRDVEALAATCPTIPVTPLPDVRWTPQIRSVSGPVLDKSSDREFAFPPPKRARSPPPFIKPQSLFAESSAKSAPAHALSFSQNEPSHLPRSSRGVLSPPVSPQALTVSGMQTRLLGRAGVGSHRELVM